MAITFSCHHCGKSLTTSDDKAGRKAKCPGCGEVLTVPESEFSGSVETEPAETDGDADGLPSLTGGSRSEGSKTCPMCGEKNLRRASACEFCGEEFTGDDSPRRRRRGDGSIRTDVEVGEVLSDAWERFKANFGICVGAQLVGSIVIGIGFIPTIVLAVVIIIMMDQNKANPEPPLGPLLGLIPAVLVGMLVTTYMIAGMNRFYLTVARQDENIDFTTIFKGNRYFLPLLGYGMLYGLCCLLGLCALGVGTLAVMVLGWPILFVVCDPEHGEGSPINRTLALTKPNWVTSLLVVMVHFGMQFALSLVGAIPCIGPIVSLASILIQPFFQLIFATAYVKLSGQD